MQFVHKRTYVPGQSPEEITRIVTEAAQHARRPEDDVDDLVADMLAQDDHDDLEPSYV